ncbi:TonB-dependent receptor [Zhongshania marina]|uniref:TonB-dependent receptor n=1 Tax=Zhongshania marina TaxID=2304603 RepID=A0A2S4HIZ2_9GAMM|nr:TonB-dependent receptor [Marortus luteolus]POP53965.1 TonB-dependent receptor [Marortus luteolus]RNL66689.1 TonB-dependent receptor [Zhongshania marina]
MKGRLVFHVMMLSAVSSAAQAAGNRFLEEVVVTAQKREQSQQEVPISIQAYGGEKLEAFGIEDTTQLAQIVPNLQFTSSAGYNLIYLRGVGTDAFALSSDPSVATYIDGVYLPAAHGVLQSFAGVERVEVLKGPQGTLFGRNSTGGAISVVTKDPDPNEIVAELSADFGNYNQETYKAHLSLPVTETLAFSISALSDRRDEFYTQNGNKLPEKFTDAGRVKIAWFPTENLDFGFTYFKSHQGEANSAVAENNQPSALGGLLGIPAGEVDYNSETDFQGGLESHQEIYYVDATLSLSWADIKAMASDVFVPSDYSAIDFDGSNQGIARFDSRDQFSDYRTFELQVTSNPEGWMGDSFEWVMGYYYYESEAGYPDVSLFVGPNLVKNILLENRSPALDPLYEVLDSVLDIVGGLPVVSNTPLGEDGIDLQLEGLLGTESHSVYFQTTWSPTSWFDFTVGGRYQEEDRFLLAANSAIVLTDLTKVNLFDFDLDSQKSTNFSPKAVASFYPAEDVMVYASWSQGYKSATYNIISIYTPPDYVEPEEVTNIELGIKSDWLDKNLRINAAVFDIEIDNLQSGFVSLLAGGAVTLENAGAAKIQGVEFDFVYSPTPVLNPGLVLAGGAGYLDAIYEEYKNGSGYDEATGLFSSNLDFSGNRIGRTPDLTANITIAQVLEIGDFGELEIAVDHYYNSGFYYSPQNTVEEPEYTLTNGRVSFLYTPLNLRLTGYAKNILETEYHYAKFQTDFGVNQTLGAPKQYGLRLEWQY